jgi:hypothetical protein
MNSTTKHFIITFCAVLTFIEVSSQTSQLIKLNSVEIDADQVIGIDKFDNLYYINQNTIFKRTPNNETIAFQDVLLGDIEKVDILNPNKISVFYKMANTVVILDNRMTEILRHDFNNISPFRNVGFSGTSKDQGLWIYNMDTNQLELYDYRLNKSLFQTLPIDEEILELKNNFNFCYLRTPSKILIFNIYGSFIGDIPLKDFKHFDLSKNNLILHQGNQLEFYNKDYELEKSINFNFKGYQNLLYTFENLYIYNNKNLTTYSIEQ